MPIGWILTSVVIISIAGLGLIVYLNSPKNKINRIFILLVFWIVLWMISNFLENELGNLKLAEFFLRADFASASFLVYYWFVFCLHFPYPNETLSKVKKVIIAVPAFAFFFLSLFSNLVIYNISIADKTIHFDFGKLYSVYSLYILFYMIIGGCGYLILKYRKIKGGEKRQVFYVLLGLLISASIASILNLFFQQILPVEVFRMGVYSFTFLVGFTAYAILKHHLFDIKVIAAEIFTFLISITMLVNALYSKNLFYEGLLKGSLFVATTFFGYLLIRSVLKEVEQKEKLAELNIALQKANEELRKLDDAKTEFISIASHQLRTPLTAIKGFVSMMIEGDYGKFSGEQDGILDKVFASNERLILLVDNLLDISRMEQGRMNYTFEKMSAEDLVENIVDELKQTAKMKGLNLQFMKPKKSLLQIVGDEMKLRQVFMNLIDNAIKYTAKGAVEVKTEIKNNKFLFSVKDTGAGIAPHEQANLFKRFSRGTRIPKLHVGGSGLGLYVALKVTEAHHGKIWAESPGEGKGSAFFVRLPVG